MDWITSHVQRSKGMFLPGLKIQKNDQRGRSNKECSGIDNHILHQEGIHLRITWMSDFRCLSLSVTDSCFLWWSEKGILFSKLVRQSLMQMTAWLLFSLSLSLSPLMVSINDLPGNLFLVLLFHSRLFVCLCLSHLIPVFCMEIRGNVTVGMNWKKTGTRKGKKETETFCLHLMTGLEERERDARDKRVKIYSFSGKEWAGDTKKRERFCGHCLVIFLRTRTGHYREEWERYRQTLLAQNQRQMQSQWVQRLFLPRDFVLIQESLPFIVRHIS